MHTQGIQMHQGKHMARQNGGAVKEKETRAMMGCIFIYINIITIRIVMQMKENSFPKTPL